MNPSNTRFSYRTSIINLALFGGFLMVSLAASIGHADEPNSYGYYNILQRMKASDKVIFETFDQQRAAQAQANPNAPESKRPAAVEAAKDEWSRIRDYEKELKNNYLNGGTRDLKKYLKELAVNAAIAHPEYETALAAAREQRKLAKSDDEIAKAREALKAAMKPLDDLRVDRLLLQKLGLYSPPTNGGSVAAAPGSTWKPNRYSDLPIPPLPAR